MDSSNKIITCMQLAFRDLGYPAPLYSEVKNIIGLSLPVAIGQLSPAISVSASDKIAARYVEHFQQADQQPCALFPNVKTVLERLRAEGHYLALATSKSRMGLERVLANLGWQQYFDASRCADETLSKPEPLMLVELLAEFALPASDAIMIGDTEYDLLMANSAGVASIAVSYGAHSKERLLKCQPLACIDDFQDLLNVVLL